ncbi:MAG: hypothetical protein WA981_02005 [Glaciecola sp.]
MSAQAVCLFLLLLVTVSASQKALAESILTRTQLANIGAQIYQNETGSNPRHLIAWNNGESFASLGIGHFIWFPQGLKSPFTETFPDLLRYLIAQGVDMPNWLAKQQDFPWQTKAEYEAAKGSQAMLELRMLLENTFEHQVNFIYRRMQRSLPLMLAQLDAPSEKQHVTAMFTDLATSERGMYALIDYVNFKGEGISPKERYNGDGWGLLQVLSSIDPQTTNIHKGFSQACKQVLSRRVKQSPQQAVEKKWLAGWHKRCDTYSRAQISNSVNANTKKGKQH